MDTLVDSNVIIDLLTQDSPWEEWSRSHIHAQANIGTLVINPIIYAEISVRLTDQTTLSAALTPSFLRRDALPWDAAPLAAKAFIDYRRRGGQKTSPLPDFYIGAHAVVTGMTLLTRDRTRYSTYFPQARLIAP